MGAQQHKAHAFAFMSLQETHPSLLTICLQIYVVDPLCSALCPLVWPLMADVTSDCRERGRSGSSSGGLGGAGGGGQSELQLQRQRVIARRKALQRKLSEVNSIPVLAGIALLLMLISHRHNHEPMKAS